MRDQANKTLEIYLQRIRKYSQTLPETALPTSSGSSQPTVSAPRSGTAQDTWTGWAISSFTNKVAGVRGEIQTTTNGNAQPRPALVSRSETERPASLADSIPSKPFSLGSLPASNTHSSSSLPALSVDEESRNSRASKISFDNPLDSTLPDEWANEPDLLADSLQPTMSKSAIYNPFTDIDAEDNANTTFSTTATIDANQEPDFAGWLAAQSKSKAKSKSGKTLPKGLAPSASSSSSAATAAAGTATAKRPTASSRAATTGSAAISTKTAKKKPIVGGARPKGTVVNAGGTTTGAAGLGSSPGGKEEKKDEKADGGGDGNDDGWGDDWT